MDSRGGRYMAVMFESNGSYVGREVLYPHVLQGCSVADMASVGAVVRFMGSNNHLGIIGVFLCRVLIS
jgi:hypothetical protein